MAISLIVILAGGSTAFAQGSAELEATIREVILSDPRSADMTEASIDAMVAALLTEAETQGVTPADIVWRPDEEAPWIGSEDGAGAACGYSTFLCAINEAFGFSGSPLVIPLLLAITSAILLFVIGSMLLHFYGHHPFAGNLRKEE